MRTTPRLLTAAAALAVLLVAGLGGAVRAETDIVLDNETSGTEVDTGDSSFENSSTESTSSGVTVDKGDRPQSFVQSPAQAQGTAETFSSAQQQVAEPKAPASPSQLLDRADARRLQQTIEALFVGFPQISTSLSP